MFKKIFSTSVGIALLSVGAMAGNGYQNGQKNNNQTTTLTQTQAEGLTFLAEEEKVARDVYLYLFEKWGAKVFSNIASSEQKHMDSVEKLLESYELLVPETMDEEGVFIDENLQAMYDTLIQQGDISLQEALEVGVLIEETDIDDIQILLQENPPSDVTKVYENLLDGSHNHLDAFTRQLSK